MTTREKIQVMEAFERGKEVEELNLSKGIGWKTTLRPAWNFEQFKYRVKPKPEHLDGFKVAISTKWGDGTGKIVNVYAQGLLFNVQRFIVFNTVEPHEEWTYHVLTEVDFLSMFTPITNTNQGE